MNLFQKFLICLIMCCDILRLWALLTVQVYLFVAKSKNREAVV